VFIQHRKPGSSPRSGIFDGSGFFTFYDFIHQCLFNIENLVLPRVAGSSMGPDFLLSICKFNSMPRTEFPCTAQLFSVNWTYFCWKKRTQRQSPFEYSLVQFHRKGSLTLGNCNILPHCVFGWIALSGRACSQKQASSLIENFLCLHRHFRCSMGDNEFPGYL